HICVYSLKQGQAILELHLPRGRPRCLAYRPSGGTLAIGTDCGAIWLYNLATGDWEELTIRPDGNFMQIAFSSDGTAIAGQIDYRYLCLCDLETQQLRMNQEIFPTDFAVSPDGRTIAAIVTTGAERRVVLYNVITGYRLMEWTVPNGH